eukprot:15441825-Alexandrium_andersonii.AAC.1
MIGSVSKRIPPLVLAQLFDPMPSGVAADVHMEDAGKSHGGSGMSATPVANVGVEELGAPKTPTDAQPLGGMR